MEKRFTSSNKRIIEFCDLMESMNLKSEINQNRKGLEEWGSSSKKISQEKTRVFLNGFLKPYRFEISEDYTCPNNIGNNHQYDVIDRDVLDEVETRIGHLSINNLMGYSVAVYIEDMDGNRVGREWIEVNTFGVETRFNKDWIDWKTYAKKHELNWNLNGLKKESEIRSCIRQCVDEGILQKINGHIMVIRETSDGSTLWYPMTYDEVIEDLKDEKQFQSLQDAVKEIKHTSQESMIYQFFPDDSTEYHIYDIENMQLKVVWLHRDGNEGKGTICVDTYQYADLLCREDSSHSNRLYDNGYYDNHYDSFKHEFITDLSKIEEILGKDAIKTNDDVTLLEIIEQFDRLRPRNTPTFSPNNYGKIIRDMVKLANESFNHTWFLEIDDFIDGKYTQDDLDELYCDLQSIKESGVDEMDTIVEMFDNWKDAEETGDPVATFYGAFLHLFQYENDKDLDEDLDEIEK